MTPIQIIIIGVVFIALIAVGFIFVLNQEDKKKKRALDLIRGNQDPSIKGNSEQDLQNKRRAEIAKKLKDSKDESASGKKKNTIGTMIAQSGLSMSVQQYWIFCFVSAIAFAILSKLMGASGFVMVMFTIFGFFGFPRFFLKRKAAKRQAKFLEEFPDALEATVRLLKAGMPISEAIAMISREYDGPVGEEMRIIYDKQKIGIPMHEAATEATYRIPLAEMQMFATGLAIQAQTGSSLSEVLMNLSGVIRSRFRLKRKVKALSSEAIASASIIGALPVLLSLGMYFMNPDYLMVLFTDSFGNLLLIGAIVWMCIGCFVMKAMINFKV